MKTIKVQVTTREYHEFTTEVDDDFPGDKGPTYTNELLKDAFFEIGDREQTYRDTDYVEIDTWTVIA